MQLNVKSVNYITIQGWMRTKLDLKGNDLLVYAIIFGFTQAESHRFTGSLQYLADWCGATKQGIVKNLNTLIEKGYIRREDRFINGVKFVEYYTTQFNGSPTQLVDGVQQSLPNNIDNKSIDNTIVKGFSDDMNAVFNEWLQYKKEKKQTYQPTGLQQLINRLQADIQKYGERTVINAIRNSMSQGWAGIYIHADDQKKDEDPPSYDIDAFEKKMNTTVPKLRKKV